MRIWMSLTLALATTSCSGPHQGTTAESLDACLVAARSYAEPAHAPCAETLRASVDDVTSRWTTFTPYQRFFLRQALPSTIFPSSPHDASVEACAAVATAPVHWLGAPVISPTPLATTVLAVPDIEGCLMPIVADETRESFLDDGEGNTVAQANALTRGDVAAWFIAQLRHEAFALNDADRAAHRTRLGQPQPVAPVVAPHPVSPWSAVDARLRSVCVAAGVNHHVTLLRAANPAELDASCINEDFPSLAAHIDAFRGPTVTRTGACEESRCLLRLESVTPRTVSALHIWYTDEPPGTAREIRCEVLRGG